jgi:hypothetical protein
MLMKILLLLKYQHRQKGKKIRRKIYEFRIKKKGKRNQIFWYIQEEV